MVIPGTHFMVSFRRLTETVAKLTKQITMKITMQIREARYFKIKIV